jgi:hypothetical protein
LRNKRAGNKKKGTSFPRKKWLARIKENGIRNPGGDGLQRIKQQQETVPVALKSLKVYSLVREAGTHFFILNIAGVDLRCYVLGEKNKWDSLSLICR